VSVGCGKYRWLSVKQIKNKMEELQKFYDWTNKIEKWFVENKSLSMNDVGKVWMKWNYNNQNIVPYLIVWNKYHEKPIKSGDGFINPNLEWTFASKESTSKHYELLIIIKDKNLTIRINDKTKDVLDKEYIISKKIIQL